MKESRELLDYLIEKSEKKANRNILSLAMLGFMAGSLISLGAVGNIIASADFVHINPGVAKLVGASVFPVGLIGIVLLGYDLFTSNCLLSSAVFSKRISLKKYILNLMMVLLFNFLGCLFISYITVITHTFSQNDIAYLKEIASHKVHADFYSIILKGILCNVLVCGATLMAYTSSDVISKIFAIWFPIMLFILLGYDHIIANMLYLPTAYALNTGITISQILYNFLFAGIGNFIGGAIFIVCPLYYSSKKGEKNAKN